MKVDKRTQKRIDIIFLLFENDFKKLDEDHEKWETSEFKLAQEIISLYPKIDEIISLSLKNYQIGRLNKVDLAIIRYATYEMLMSKTPYEIIINEAIVITKIYSDIKNKEHKFNNKLLDNIKEYIKKIKESEKNEK